MSEDNKTIVQSDSEAKRKGWLAKEEASFPNIPGFEIIRELGHGGMGIVYEARHLGLNREVALKIPIQASMAAGEERKRFKSEAEAIAQLNHPGIVSIHEIGEHNGCPFICMQLLKGGSLVERLKDRKAKDVRYFVNILEQIAVALQHAHDRGVIHRDLKPSNVLFDENDTPCIADFGLAKLTYSEKYTTLSGAIGTPSYMSPEQVKGKADQITTKSDIYSFGALMYEVLTGVPPFQRDTPFATMKAIDQDEIALPSKVNSHVDRELEAVCMKCLERTPANRYQSAAELSEDFTRWLNGKPTTQRPYSLLWRVKQSLKNNISLILMIMVVSVLTGALPALTLNSLITHGRHEYMIHDPSDDIAAKVIKTGYPIYSFYIIHLAPFLANNWVIIFISSFIILLFADVIIVRLTKSPSLKRAAFIGLSLAITSALLAALFGGVQVAIQLHTDSMSESIDKLVHMALNNYGPQQSRLFTFIYDDKLFYKNLPIPGKDIPVDMLPRLYSTYLRTRLHAGTNNAILLSISIIFVGYFLFHIPICIAAQLPSPYKSELFRAISILDLQICYLFLWYFAAAYFANYFTNGKIGIELEPLPSMAFSMSIGWCIFNITCYLFRVRSVLKILFYVSVALFIWAIEFRYY